MRDLAFEQFSISFLKPSDFPLVGAFFQKSPTARKINKTLIFAAKKSLKTLKIGTKTRSFLVVVFPVKLKMYSRCCRCCSYLFHERFMRQNLVCFSSTIQMLFGDSAKPQNGVRKNRYLIQARIKFGAKFCFQFDIVKNELAN